jgi:hypothetical protein
VETLGVRRRLGVPRALLGVLCRGAYCPGLAANVRAEAPPEETLDDPPHRVFGRPDVVAECASRLVAVTH